MTFPASVSQAYPLTSPQREIWFDQMLHADAPLYNIGGYMRLEGLLDVALFMQASQLLVQKHNALRTVLHQGQDDETVPMQSFADELPVGMALLDFSSHADPLAAAMAWMKQRFSEPFNLQGEPLFRYALLQLGADSWLYFACYHHLIADGWTIALLVRSLAALYTSLQAGEDPDLATPPYSAFIDNDQNYLSSPTYGAQQQYWLQKFQPLPEPLLAARQRNGVAESSAPGQCSTLSLARDWYDRLGAFARAQGGTTFHAILAALYVYFTRTTQRPELVVGLPVLNRANAVFKATAGLFVGVTAARLRFDSANGFAELVRAIGRELKQDYRHQRFPISTLNRDLGRVGVDQPQLFDIGVSYERHNHEAAFGPTRGISIPLVNEHQTTPLMLYVREFHDDEPVQVDFVFNKAYFTSDEIGAIQKRLTHLLDVAQLMPATPVGMLPLLPQDEAHQIASWNRTARTSPDGDTLLGLIAKQVERHPDHAAVIVGDQQLSYRQLDEKSNQLARFLVDRHGVGPDTPVGLCVERSTDMIVGMLGILKAGGAYVPLDPSYPADRMQRVLDDARMPVLLTQQRLAVRIPAAQTTLVCLDTEGNEIAACSAAALEDNTLGDHLAYVIYTSGSTGVPKGVMVSRCNLLHSTLARIDYYQQPVERFLMPSSFAFDSSVAGIFWTLCSGGTLCLPREQEHNDAAALLRLIEQHAASHLLCIPSFHALLLDLAAHWQMASLSTVIVAGEACGAELVERHYATVPHTALFNEYGPTEGSVWSTVHRCLSQREVGGSAVPVVPIGQPIGNVQIHLLDQHLEPVPVGVPAEIYIGGAGVTRGYMGSPEVTAEKFLPCPFSDMPGARMYKSGDLGRWLPDGRIEYLGRIDHQVKIRGYRIELTEIEAALLALPPVREAAVLAREDQLGNKRLVAYAVMHNALAVPAQAAAALKEALRQRLPRHMVPDYCVVLERMPLTANGKVDRSALPAPQFQLGERDSVAPRTRAEIMLAQLWMELLQCGPVGVHDSFFELGGHSLLAARLVARIRTAFQLELPLRAIFEMPTVQQLARHIEQSQEHAVAMPRLERCVRESGMPLSFGQQRLWFLERLEGTSALYNMPLALHIKGHLDVAALEAALNALVQRHEVLRTTFALQDDTAIQIIHPYSKTSLPLLDLTGLPADEKQDKADALASEEASRPFDLGTGPLLRAQLLRLDEQEHCLLLTAHHIVADGWSLGVLVQELATVYPALQEGRVSPSPELAIQYADFAHWQRQWLQGPERERQLDYWRQQLHGAPGLLELPTDRPRPAVARHRGAYVSFTLPAQLHEGLNRVSQQAGATLFMTLLAGFNLLLHRYSGQDDLCIGTPIANRNHVETEDLIGFFVNTLVLRSRITDEQTFAQLLAQTKEAALQAYAHQDLPFEHLVEALRPERSRSHAPLFQVMFVLQNAPLEELTLPGLQLTMQENHSGTAKFDLTLSMTQSQGQLQGVIEYDTDLYEAISIERMAGHYRVLLEAAVGNPQARVYELPLLTDAEHRQLADWNATQAPYPQNKCIHELFEEQARKTPQAMAVMFEEQQLTYSELDARANRLACLLRDKGVGPDARVAICVERSVDMVIGLLGILKAGGAYVPLDPGYPRERLEYMLEDAQPLLLLTQSDLLSSLPVTAAPTLLMDIQPDVADAHTSSTPDARTAGLMPQHLAYVIYTSGSTGRPKGVAVPHEGVVNRLDWMQRAYGLSAADRVLQKTPFGFDVSVWEFFWPLLTGAALVVAKPDVHRDPSALAQIMRDQQISVMHFVPPMLGEFLHATQGQRFDALRLVICSGEALPYEVQQSFLQQLPAASLHNLYGPTEASIDVSYWPCATPLENKVVPIGRPIANTQLYILDRYLNPVPVGVHGELHIAGIGLARGYLNRPDLTAEKFIANPFGAEPNARMYKTGDRVRYLADGNIEYLGRFDHQVKIRGFRIELGEIEACLLTHPSVRDAVVVAHGAQADKRLVAYITTSEDVGAETLRGHLAETLPEHMLPSAYVTLEKLPLTPNGKIDRKALPVPDIDAYITQTYEAPQGETENALARIWAELLKLDRIGRHDNFFELGGHSLLAVRLLEQMRRQGWHADVRALFAQPTLAGLAAATAQHSTAITIPPNRIPPECTAITPDMLPLVALAPADIDRIVGTVPGGAANVQDIYPLAPLQEGILFHHLLTTEGDIYLLRFLFAAKTREPIDRFLNALQAVVNRHDILRTSILWEGLPEPVQVVLRQAELPVEEFTLHADADGKLDIAEQLSRRFDPQHFQLDLRQAPMLRACVAHDPVNQRWLLVLVNHHLILDNTSLRFLLHEVRMHLAGQAHQLPAPMPFRNVVAQTRLDTNTEEHEAFFRRMLGDVDEMTAPFGLQNTHGEISSIADIRRDIDPDLARRLRAQVRASGVSAASLFHLAWAQVLARTSGRSDVVFGTVLFGRMQGGAGADQVMGLFINTLPLRVRIGQEGVATTLRRTHALLAELLRHEHAPLSLAQRCSALPASTPLFSALLNYRHSAQDTHEAHVSPSSRVAICEGMELLDVHERSNYPFCLSVDDLGEGFSLSVQTAAIVDPARVYDFMHSSLEQLVQALEIAPDTPVHAIDVLTTQEREQLHAWNRTAMALPPQQTIHQLFEARAASHADQIAAVFEEQRVTYAELNARANRLAHYLREQGITADELVGICVERSLDMIVAVLGVLKAGGAYLPLDPVLPQARMAYMLQDAEPRLVLTQAHLLGRLPENEIARLCLDRDAALFAAYPDHNPAPQTQGDHLAYVIYTSGSTGNPKGTLLHHRGLVNLVLAQQQAFSLQPGCRVLQWASFNFDASVWDIFTALTAGARLYLAPSEAVLPGQNLMNTLRRHHIELVTLTPSSLAALPAEPLPELKTLVVAGERCDHALIAPWVRRYTVINAYGPTEATVCATVYPCADDGQRHPPIGRPIANTQIYILDAWLQPVPIGVTGELYIGGEGLARGYLGRPDLTAERFVQNPFSSQPGARMYRSGDLARYLPDGKIEYAGRIDEQVKIRGYRIELGEIEFALAQLPLVHEAVVLAQDAPAGGRQLVAYVVPQMPQASHETDASTTDQLRAALRRSLPDYMVPAHFVLLDKLPINTNGKIDRKALDALEWSDTAHVCTPPATPTEKQLAALWSELLSRDSIGREDNFFHIGGHSLLAVRLIARINEVFRITLPLSQLFTAPSIAALAAIIDARQPASQLVVPLKDSESGLPIWLIHPAGGTVFCYRKLAAQLPADRPVYAIQSPEIAGFDPEVHDFDGLCRRYLAEVQRVQPGTDPICLGGWSMGGAIAFRLAELLEQAGRPVASVSLFDTMLHRNARPQSYPEFVLWAFTRMHADAWATDAPLAAARERVASYLAEHGEAQFCTRFADDLPSMENALSLDASYMAFLQRQYAIQQSHAALMAGFVPGKINAPLHAFQAEESVRGEADSPDWLSYTRQPQESTQHIMEGHHDNIILLQTNIEKIAQTMVQKRDA